MRIALRTLPAMIALLFLVSCSKNDHEPEPSCIFTGKTLVEETKGSFNSKFTSTIELDSENPDMPNEIRRTTVDERTEGPDNLPVRKTTETYKYNFQYDVNGFLTMLVRHRSFIFEGVKGSYLYGNRSYRNFKLDEVTTYEYVYQANLASSVSIKTITTEQPDNSPAVVTELEQTKVYKYDVDGKALSAFTISPAGEIKSTFMNGIIATSISTNKNGTVLSDTRYNEMGLPLSISSNNSLFEMSYDKRGNLVGVKTSSEGRLLYRYELHYDDFENPENTIKKLFKGIPEVIPTVQSTDGVNNTISENAIDDKSQLISEYKTTYQYNNSGLPVSAVRSLAGDTSGQKRVISFRYKCP